MSRDFHSLDRLRLDKYLYLIRCYVGVAFDIFINEGLSSLNGRNNSKNKNKNNGAQATTEGEEEKEEPKERGGRKKNKKGNKKRGNEDANGAEKNSKRRKHDASRSLDAEKEEDDENNNNTNDDKNDDDANNGNKSTGAWSELEVYIDMLEEGPLCPYNFLVNNDGKKGTTSSSAATPQQQSITMPKGPDGIRYHVMDLWLDEIEKVATETETQIESVGNGNDNDGNGTQTKLKQGVPMELLLRPIEKLKENAPYKPVRRRAETVLDDERLVQWGVKERKKEEDEDDEDDDEWGGFDA